MFVQQNSDGASPQRGEMRAGFELSRAHIQLLTELGYCTNCSLTNIELRSSSLIVVVFSFFALGALVVEGTAYSPQCNLRIRRVAEWWIIRNFLCHIYDRMCPKVPALGSDS